MFTCHTAYSKLPQEVWLDIKFKFCVVNAEIDIGNLHKEYRTPYNVYQLQTNASEREK